MVVKAWAERPESSSEEEEEEKAELHRKNANQINLGRRRSLWKRVSSVRLRGGKRTLTESTSYPLSTNSEPKSGVQELPKPRINTRENHLAAPTLTMSDPEFSDDDKQTEKESGNSELDRKEPKRSRREIMDIVLRGAARAVGKLKHNAKKTKFNFEKYISFLQNVLGSVGFDIMGIVVTWDMVSTIIFLEISVLALFVQETIFGNSKATVTL